MNYSFHIANCLLFVILLPKCLPYPTTQIEPNYKKALKLSLLFYEAQRSGKLPSTNRVPWRGDSALDDKGINGEDLSGGYYDAGDYVKFSFTMAFSTTLLSWGMISYKDAYQHAGQYEEGLEAIKWATDYFIKCHTKPTEFYGQVGSFAAENSFWGRPEDMNVSRPAYKIDENHPGSDLAGEASAALASASVVFRESGDPSYADELVRHAKELLDFALKYSGLYHTAIPAAKSYYESTGYADELVWAAVWLYKATEDLKYLEKAESLYLKFRIKERPNEFFYNKKVAGIQVLLARHTHKPDYLTSVRSFCDFSLDDQQRTPRGLLYIDKTGTLSHAANVAFICLQAAGLNISVIEYVAFAREQIDYILGAGGRSYVVGYGEKWPRRPHHIASSCANRPAKCTRSDFDSTKPNPQVLYGALVSGPDQNDRYEDSREEFLYNEVTLDYNAGFQSTLAGLIHYQNKI